ncbi:MAG: nucleoside monophosphate kinase, partial [Bacteroidota bacterium]|nr:nucleoside monophosphate kinase [Bacteroidota bacterium]
QAEALEKIFCEQKITKYKVINIEVDKKLIIERLTDRAVCGQCGKIYNFSIDKFKAGDKCFKCGGPINQREDDKPETVKKRLEIYHNTTSPVKEYYQKNGKLINIDGIGEIEDVTKRLLQVL